MSLDPMKDRLATINRRVAELDASIVAEKTRTVIDLPALRELRATREQLWREMQDLVSSAIGA